MGSPYLQSDKELFFCDWFTAGDFVRTEEKCSGRETSMVGKALKKLAIDGHLEVRKAGGNKTQYRSIPQSGKRFKHEN